MAFARKTTASKADKAADIKKEEVLSTVKPLTQDDVATLLTKAQLAVQQQFADITTKATNSLAQFEQIEQAIQIKKQELQALHELDVQATTLDDLNRKIAETREGWDAEKQAATDARTQYEADTESAREREQAEYEYTRDQERRRQQDAFNEELAAARKTEQAAREQREKDWQQREEIIKSAETELRSLRDQVAGFPAKIDQAVKAEVDSVVAALTAQNDTKFQLAQKDADLRVKMAEQQVTSAKAEIIQKNEVISDLRTQLAAAHKQSESVALKALESASGRNALEAVQQSMNRAESQPPRSGR